MTDRSRLKKKKQKKGNERRGNAKAAQQARQNLKNTAKKIEEKITQSSARTQGSSSYGGNAPGRRGGSNNTQRPSASASINRRNERQTQYYGGISKDGKVKTTAERMKERTEARELQRDNIRRGNKNAAPHRMDSNVQNSLRDRLKQSQQPDIIKAAAQQQVGGYEKFIGNMTRGEATGKSGAMNRKLGGSSNTKRNDRLKPGQVVGKRPDNTETIKNIQKQRQKSADQISERGSKNIQEGSKAIEDIKERNLAGAITYDENGNPVVDKKKKRAGDFKNWMLDLEVAGLQMGGDALVGVGTGGLGGMASMFARAGGMAMDEAERAGASRDQVIKYGLAIGGVEALTEKIGAVASPLRKVYGKGVTDTLMEKIIGKMAAKTTAGEIGQRTFMSALTEGLEEMVAEGVEPTVANKIYADTVASTRSDEVYNDAISKGYSEEEARRFASEAYNAIHQSTSLADIFRAGSIGAAMGGILGGAGNVIEAGRGAAIKDLYGKDGIREMAKKAKDSDDDTVVARATAILDQIDNGGDVTAGQANAVFNAVQAQEAKDDETMRRYDAGIYAEMRRNGYESPLVEDEENGVVGLNRIASDKYQAVMGEAREAAGEVVDSEEESGAIAEAIAAVMTGIASPQQVSMFTTSNPQARAVFESVTGETLPKSNAQMREKLFAMSARNYVETAKEETDYLRDQINGVLNIDMTQDYGSSGQSVFADVMEDEAIDPRDNNKTVAASAFEDYYRAGALGIPMEQILQNGNPQHSTLSMQQKQAAYEAGIRDAQAQTSIPAGSAIAMGERMSMAKTGRPTGMLYVELSDETKPMFTGSQQRMYRELAKRLHINIHIVDDIVDDEGNVVGANGYYNKGEVYLSMNNDRGLELVFGHEVTHLIKASSPEAYAKLEELVRDRWEEQGGIDEAIKAKQEQYKNAVGQSLSESDALEEIIADATYEMFGDPEFVAKICAEEKTLGKTILYAIRTILANIRAALASSGGFTPSQNAQLLSQLDILSEFEDLWLQGLRDAARMEARQMEAKQARMSVKEGDFNGNPAIFNGKPFWSGIASALDGYIEEVRTIQEAENAGFHHSLYFTPEVARRIDEDESVFFWVDDDGTVETMWRDDEAPANIVRAIKSQIVTKGDTRFSVREDDFVRISPQRMDNLIDEYAIPGNETSNYTKAWIATINPRDFLTLTISDEVLSTWTRGSVNSWGQEVRDLEPEELTAKGKYDPKMPFLRIQSKDSHSVVGHEGRHRMKALMDAGYTEVPVVIVDWNEATKSTKEPMDTMDLWSQDFGNGAVNDTNEGMGADVDVYDVIPINEKNRAEIERIYGGEEGVRFSVPETDSEGRKLTEAQREYFKDSKVVDEEGRLKVVYHSTDSGGFTVFDPKYSDDKISLFFTDSLEMSQTYAENPSMYDSKSGNAPKKKGLFKSKKNANSLTYPVYLNLRNPLVIDATGQEWDSILDPEYRKINVTPRHFTLNGEEQTVYDVEGRPGMTLDAVRNRYGDTFADQIEGHDFAAMDERDLYREGVNFYSHNGEPYNPEESGYPVEASTREWAEEAKKRGHDGVVFKGIIDNGSNTSRVNHGDVYVAFDSNQVKDVNNENPTENADIRYSVKDDNRVMYTPSGVEVVQNPTDSEYRSMREEILKEYPWLRGTGEVLLRKTYDEDGNTYYWDASAAIHAQVEPYINETYNTRTSQQWKWYESPFKDEYPVDYSKTRFSVKESPEQVRDLIAVHNLSEDKLKKTLALGGFPMPSIAVTNLNHENFGDISLLFGSETIDPKRDRNNKVYSADAWTPTVPETETKYNDKVLRDIRTKIENILGLQPYQNTVADGLRIPSFDESNIEHSLRYAEPFDAFGKNEAMQLAYLKSEKNFDVAIPTKPGQLQGYDDDFWEHIDDAIPEMTRSEAYNMSYDDAMKYDPIIRKALQDEFKKKVGEKATSMKRLPYSEPLACGKVTSILSDLVKYRDEGGIPSTTDMDALHKTLSEKVDEEGYRKWIDGLFDGVVEKTGIRNNKDLFTPSGNRRSWDSLHDPVTVENIVKAMKAQGEKNISMVNTVKTLRADTAKSFKSLDEIRKNKTKLKDLSEKDVQAVYDELDAKYSQILDDIIEANPSKNKDNMFFVYDEVAETISECAQTGIRTAEGIKKKYQSYQWNVSEETANDILQLFDAIENMPVNMFEAKPRRAVGFDEVKAAIVPNTTSDEIKNELSQRGIPVTEYDPSVEGDRADKVNLAADEHGIKFSVREQPTEPTPIPNEEDAIDYANGDPALAEFAYDSSPYAQAGKAVREKSYDELKAKVERLQADKRLTHGRVLDTTSIRKDVENMLRTMASIAEQAGNPVLGLEGKMNKANARLVNDIIKNAKHIYKMMKSGREEEAVIAAMNVADDIVERIQVIDDAEYDTYKEMKKYLRETPITISEEDASSISDFGTFKKNLFGKVRIVKEGGLPVDSVYEELMEMFPGVFDEELTHPADQLMAIVDAREAFEPYDVMLTAEEREQLLKDTTMELIDIIADGEPWRSWADKKSEQYQNKVKMLQERHREALRSRTEKERARAERLVQAEKTKAKQKKEKAKDKKERLKAFGSIEKNHKWLSDRLLKPTDDKHIPEDYKIAVADLLMTLDLQTERSKALEEKTGRVAQKTFKFRELLDAYEEIANPEGTGILEYDDTIVSMLKDSLAIKLDGKSVDALDTATMREVDTLLKAIVGNIKNVNKAFAAERDQTIEEMAARVTADCNHIIDKRGTFSERKKNLKRYFLETSKVINIGMKKPREFFTHLGKGMTDAYMEIRHGEDKHFRNMQVLRGKFESIFKQYNNKKKPGSAIEKWRDTSTLQTFELENGESVKLNIAQVMSLYCLSKREQALGHIYGSGIVPSKVEGISGKIIHKKNEVEGSKVMVTYGDVMKIIDSLTEEQRTMADQLQALLNNEVAAWGNETSMLLYNYEKFTEKNYFPIKSDDAYLDSSFEGRTAEERIRNFGFTKGTITNANNPIVIADIFEVVTDHCNKMSLYNSFAAPLADFTRLYNSKFRNEDGTLNSSVKDMITKAYGKDTHEYIQNFMADVNNNTQVRPDETRAVVNKFLANYKRATIGMNMRVAVQQPTAIVRAFDVIDPKYFVADKQVVAPWKIKRDIKEMCDHCPIAMWKSWGHNDVDMARDLDDIMMNKAWSRFDIVTMGTYGALDIWTWSKIWNAVKREVKAKNPDVEVGSEEYWDLCNERASEVFDRTQVVDSVLHRSQTMRSKDTMTKMISSFMAEPTTTFNMLQSDIAEARDLIMEGEKGKAAKKLSRCMTVFGLNAAAVSAAAAVIDLLRGKEPDDDDKDKEGFELWYANFLNNFIDNANPIKMIPYPSTAFELFEGTFGTSNMAFEGWESLAKGLKELQKYLSGDSKKSEFEVMWMVGDGIGNVLGIPIKSIDKDYHALMNRLGISFASEKGSDEKVRVTGDDGSIFEFYPGENMSLTEKFFKMIGIEDNSKTDNFLNKFGINLSEEEKQEQEYQNRKDEILKKCEGLEGEEREKKLWSIITGKKDEENLGITSYIESADFDKVEEMKKLYVACGGDKATFDEKVIKKAKTAYKKTIGVNDAMDRQFDTYDFLIRNGVSEAEISEIVKSSDTAREFKKAFALGDDTSAALTLSYLTDAGLSYEDYEYLCSVASRSVKASDYATGEFEWPTNGTVTSGFGHRSSPGGIGSTNHQGMDIGAPTGNPVTAADGGKVISAGWNGGYGNCVIIDHGNGYKTLYGHLSGYEVKPGQIVKKNQQIGKVGSTGNSTGPHLHFGVMENDHYVNPANYLQR